jgi:hypothetical protein
VVEPCARCISVTHGSCICYRAGHRRAVPPADTTVQRFRDAAYASVPRGHVRTCVLIGNQLCGWRTPEQPFPFHIAQVT